MVDHVHVAVARELDAQILHFQNRRHVGARLEAVGARLLNRLKLAEALFEHLRLGGVCQRGVGHELVGLAVRADGGVIGLDRGLGRGGHGIGDALGQDVQAQHGDHDGQTREQRLPPTTGKHAAAGVGQDVAPRGRGLGNAGRDERQRRFEHDGVGHQHDGEHHDRGDAVADDVLHEDPGGAGTGNDDGAHVILIVLAHHVGAHDAGDLRDVQKADREDERGHRVAEHEYERGGQRDTGEGHDDVQDAHDDLGHPFARHGGDGADDGAAHEGEGGGAQADDQRVARAVHHTRQHVAALVVGAEQELGIGGLACREDLKRVVRRQDVGEHGDHDDQDEHDERDARSDAHGLPPAEMHLAGIGFHLISEVSSKFDHVATPS